MSVYACMCACSLVIVINPTYSNTRTHTHEGSVLTSSCIGYGELRPTLFDQDGMAAGDRAPKYGTNPAKVELAK